MVHPRLPFIAGVAALAFAARLPGQIAESAGSRPVVAEKIKVELLAPAAESRPDSRAPRPVAMIRITNENTAPAVLWPFVALKVADAQGNVVKPSSNLGRWGRRRQKCFLEAVAFTTLAPGKSLDYPVRLEQYTHDPDAIVGWKLPAGEYTLTARYAFSRADLVARCKENCESHSDPARPWNRALEVSREASLKIAVK